MRFGAPDFSVRSAALIRIRLLAVMFAPSSPSAASPTSAPSSPPLVPADRPLAWSSSSSPSPPPAPSPASATPRSSLRYPDGISRDHHARRRRRHRVPRGADGRKLGAAVRAESSDLAPGWFVSDVAAAAGSPVALDGLVVQAEVLAAVEADEVRLVERVDPAGMEEVAHRLRL
jgi:hypothetical protein